MLVTRRCFFMKFKDFMKFDGMMKGWDELDDIDIIFFISDSFLLLVRHLQAVG